MVYDQYLVEVALKRGKKKSLKDFGEEEPTRGEGQKEVG